MRVLSALISSFIVTSAVLEHPKLVARAGVWIDEWAGVRKPIPSGKIASVFMTAKFSVPVLSETGSAFVGITLGNSHQCNLNATLSIGVLMEITSNGAKYTPVHQWDRDSMERHPGRIGAKDEILMSISAVGQVPVMATIMNLSQDPMWLWAVPPNHISSMKEKPCGWFAEWKVGGTTDGGFESDPLPKFDNVTFYNAYMDHLNRIPAGLRDKNAGFFDILLGSIPIVKARPVDPPNDGFVFVIQQLLDNMPG